MTKKRGQRRTRKATPLKWCICTEGDTEALYLTAYCEELGIRHLVDINPHPFSNPSGKGCGEQHLRLINKVARFNKQSNYEKVFAVHDFDEDGKASVESFDSATEVGGVSTEMGICSVIYSIPSFEYWLLLHNNPLSDSLSRQRCFQKALNYVNDVRKQRSEVPLRKRDFKTNPDLYSYFGGKNGAESAKKHAKARWSEEGLENPPHKPSSVRPSTNFYLLLDELEKKAKSEKQN